MQFWESMFYSDVQSHIRALYLEPEDGQQHNHSVSAAQETDVTCEGSSPLEASVLLDELQWQLENIPPIDNLKLVSKLDNSLVWSTRIVLWFLNY